MRWTEEVIIGYKNTNSERLPDSCRDLVASWERSRRGEPADPTVERALELMADGSAAETELGFYVLMDLALNEPSLCSHVKRLTSHRSAAVRRGLVFHLSGDFPTEFQNEICRTLLRDKAASVRVQTISRIGMLYVKELLPDLCALQATERDQKVIESLKYWIPAMEIGYHVQRSPTPGMLLVTALTGNGTVSKNVQTEDPRDPCILRAVEELLDTL